MSEKIIESIVRDFGEAFVERDVERMLSFFTEDAVWVSPVGTFRGKEELRRVLTWDTQISPHKLAFCIQSQLARARTSYKLSP
jgi:ketosteroid isomerase-like protein